MFERILNIISKEGTLSVEKKRDRQGENCQREDCYSRRISRQQKGHGGCGCGGRGNRGGRGKNYASSSTSLKKGMCAALGTHIFDYRQKASADQMRTSWEKLIQYVGTSYGQNISNELQNKTTVTIADPEYLQVDWHAARTTTVRNNQANILAARRAQLQQVIVQ